MPNATTEEILEAFAQLSEDELLALRIYAQQHIDNSFFTEPLDLLHEALHRSLDGRRNWPGGLNFGLFMALTMRSIVSHDRRLAANRPGAQISLWDSEDRESMPTTASPEEELVAFQEVELARKAAARAQAALQGDAPAQKVLSGMLAGLSPREICASYQIDAKTFDAARHRVMRQLRSAATLH